MFKVDLKYLQTYITICEKKNQNQKRKLSYFNRNETITHKMLHNNLRKKNIPGTLAILKYCALFFSFPVF